MPRESKVRELALRFSGGAADDVMGWLRRTALAPIGQPVEGEVRKGVVGASPAVFERVGRVEARESAPGPGSAPQVKPRPARRPRVAVSSSGWISGGELFLEVGAQALAVFRSSPQDRGRRRRLERMPRSRP